MRARILRAGAVAALLVLSACAAHNGADGTGGAALLAGDTIRGTVQVSGSAPATSIVLLVGGGGVTVTGEERVLAQLDGVEVMLQGSASANRFSAGLVHVRAVAGVPAIDGVLEEEGAQHRLRTADGTRLPVPYLPAALRQHVGGRVWLAGALDRAPEAYGLILP